MGLFAPKSIAVTLIVASVAAVAGTTSAGLGWPVWAMFIGWIAFFTGEQALGGGLRSYLCVVVGITLGNLAASGIGILVPVFGTFALGAVVFVIAIVVLSLRFAPYLNNIPACFLGLVAFFAAHVEPASPASFELVAVGGLGSAAAVVAHALQTRVARA